MAPVTGAAEQTTTTDPTRERLLAAAAEVFAKKRLGQFEGKPTNILATVGSHLVTEEFDNGQALLLEAFVAARRDPEVATMLRTVVECRADEMTELIEEAKRTGAIDPSLDTLAIVRFCHAVGLGFLLFGAIDLPRPEAGPWEDLIGLLIRAVEAAPAVPPWPGSSSSWRHRRASVSTSRALDRSSITSSSGRRTSARAAAVRWICPPDSRTPRGPTTVPRPSGMAST